MSPSPIGTDLEPRGKFLNPHDLARLRNLLFGARLIVEGFYAGRHRSPFHDLSSELADFRPYCPGDDVRRLDWKAFGRADRLYVKQFRKETDMRGYLVVDTSASMAFRGSESLSKFEYGAQIAAALAFLMLRQGDRPGLALCAESLQSYVAPQGAMRSLYSLLHALEGVEPTGRTRIAAGLRALLPIARRRGLLIVLSDFLEDPADIFDALAMYTHRGFAVLLLQILTDDEIALPAGGPFRFYDSEEPRSICANPAAVRDGYRRELERHLHTLRSNALARGMSYMLLRTTVPYVEALSAYSAKRGW